MSEHLGYSWENLRSRFEECLIYSEADTKQLRALCGRAGRDLHGLVTQGSILPPLPSDYRCLSAKPEAVWFIQEDPRSETVPVTMCFWDEYWLLGLHWLHVVPGSGIVLDSYLGADGPPPDGWDMPSYYSDRPSHCFRYVFKLGDVETAIPIRIASIEACDYVLGRIKSNQVGQAKPGLATELAGQSAVFAPSMHSSGAQAGSDDSSPTAESRPLTEKQRVAFEIIAANPNGIMGKQLVAEMGKRGEETDLGTLTKHIIPKLKKQCGIVNTPGVGYHCGKSVRGSAP